MFKSIKRLLYSLLLSPSKVLIICLAIIFFNLILRGDLFLLLNLKQDLKKLAQKRTLINKEIKKIDMKIVKASDPKYLELEIRNRFDVAEKGDLIFVFSD